MAHFRVSAGITKGFSGVSLGVFWNGESESCISFGARRDVSVGRRAATDERNVKFYVNKVVCRIYIFPPHISKKSPSCQKFLLRLWMQRTEK